MTSSARPQSIVLVAAECKGIAKVGGLGDVVADLAKALHNRGVPVSILMPLYDTATGQFDFFRELEFPFGGDTARATLMTGRLGNVPVFAVANHRFFGGQFSGVYVDSSQRGGGPFEDDARRFAFFSTAAAVALNSVPPLMHADVVHCHDWHTGTLLALARLTSRFPTLDHKPFLFTIHNLDYQGTRPMEDHSGGYLTSLASWGPDVYRQLSDNEDFHKLRDPEHPHCYNPMRTAILLADAVSTVSPNYASEITRPDNPRCAFVGGRGLHEDLKQARDEGVLVGLLNGISYEEYSPESLQPPFGPDMPHWWKTKARHKELLLPALAGCPPDDLVTGPPTEEFAARLSALPLAVFVGRLAGQKVNLLLEKTSSGPTVLERIAHLHLNLAVLGTGELQDEMARLIAGIGLPNCIFVRRFDALLALRLYSAGDLFLMPSDFEPCGISQLIAMSFGTLPVATAVGGLADTISHLKTGFLSHGESRRDAADAFVQAVVDALALSDGSPAEWRRMQRDAMRKRFTWDRSAAAYVALYDAISKKRRSPGG